jgi:hypothetical protein
MALLPSFEYDVFISYSHVDNLGDDAWVERFHQALEIALARRVGRIGVVKIWRDKKKLDGDQLFDETIETAVTKSAIFLAVTSTGYLESSYCKLELQSFYQKASAEPYGLQIGDRSRICNLLLTKIPPTRWPSEYGRVSGFAFHDADDSPPGDEDRLGEPTDQAADKPRFKRQLAALADSLYKLFNAFKEQIAQPVVADAPSTTAEDGPKVFVADVADSLALIKKRLITELQRKGVRVEHGIPPPYEAIPHAEKVKAATKDGLLSIHLLDELPGREIQGEPGQTYPQRQLELARDCTQAQLVWVQKELNASAIEDEGYRALLNQYEHGEREGTRYDFVRGSSTLLVPQILEKLEQLQKVQEKSEGAGRAILLDTHLKDQLYALELGRLLLENSIQPYINPQEDDPNKNLDAFEGRLRQVTSLVILYGNVSESWVRHRLAVALQLCVIKNLPIESFSVLLVPPEKLDKNLAFQLGPVAVHLLDNSRSAVLDPSTMAPLCRSMRTGGAA